MGLELKTNKNTPVTFSEINIVDIGVIVDADDSYYEGNIVFKVSHDTVANISNGASWKNIDHVDYRVNILPKGTELVIN